MQDRVSLRRFINKRLPAGNHQRALRIQPRSLRTVVACVHHHATRKLALYIEIPDLHVAQAIVWIDREIVGYRANLESRYTARVSEWRGDERRLQRCEGNAAGYGARAGGFPRAAVYL